MWRPLRVLLLMVAFGVSIPSVQAQKFSHETGNASRLLSPAGLGPEYSGLTGVGIGLEPSSAEFGLKAGDFVIQPRLFLEGAYTTNFYRSDPRSIVNNVPTPLVDVFMLQLRPGMGLYNPGFTNVAVSMGVDANVRLPLTGTKQETDQVDVGGVAHAAFSFFPKGPFNLVLHEQFRRDLWTRPASSDATANRNKNTLGADLNIKPGGGALVFTLGYKWDIDRYDDASNMDVDRHRFRFLSSLRFYPMSYVFLESTFDLLEYPNAAPNAEGSLGNYRSGMPVRAYAGISGYFTERIALLLRLGYGNSLLAEQAAAPDNFEMFVGMAQLSIRFTPRTIWHLGVAHDFETVVFGGYRTFIRGFTSFDQRLGSFGTLHLDAAFDMRSYGIWSPYPYDIPNGGSVTPSASSPQRSDMRFRAGALIDFNLHRAFGITLGYRFDKVISDFNIGLVSPESQAQTFMGYDEHRIYSTLNLRY